MKDIIKLLIWLGIIGILIYSSSWKDVFIAIGTVVGVYIIWVIINLFRFRKNKEEKIETESVSKDLPVVVPKAKQETILPHFERKERIMYVVNDTSFTMDIVVNTPRQYCMTCKLLSQQRTVETPLHNFTKEGIPLDMFIEVRIEKYTREDGDTTTTNVTFCFDEDVFYSQNYNTILLTEKNTPNNGDSLFEANLSRLMDDETPSAASDSQDDVLAGERDE